jgi:hypothetical protein
VWQIRPAGWRKGTIRPAQKPSHGAYPQKLWISLWIVFEQIGLYLPSSMKNSVWLIFHRQ